MLAGLSSQSVTAPVWVVGRNITVTDSNAKVVSLVMVWCQVWVLESQESNVISPRCPALYWSCSVCRPLAANLS